MELEFVKEWIDENLTEREEVAPRETLSNSGQFDSAVDNRSLFEDVDE